MDRRSFVRACVAAGSAGLLGTGGILLYRSSLAPRAPLAAGHVRYFGAHMKGGPAPRGVPLLPLEAKDGVLRVRPTLRVGNDEWDVLPWLRFCAHADLPALRPGGDWDETLRYHLPGDAARVLRPWYADKLGEPVRVDDFPDEGFGARFIWRASVTGVLVKLPGGGVTFPDDLMGSAQPIVTRRERDAVERMLVDGIVAVNNWCTHFCCEAGYKEAEPLARARDAWDMVFCTCHNVQFDPREAVAYSFVPEAGPGE